MVGARHGRDRDGQRVFDGAWTARLLGMLPLDLLEEVIVEEGRQAQRKGGKLPPQTVALVLVFMALFRDSCVSSVLGKLEEAIGGIRAWKGKRPHSTRVSKGIDRLGWETMRAIFRRFSQWIEGGVGSPVRWKGFQVFAMDGTCFRTQDTEANEAWFGRPGSRLGPAGFPQVRCVALFSAFSHTIVEAAFVSYKKLRKGDAVGEVALALSILPRLKAGSLILLDRGYYAFKLLRAFVEADVCFLVRMRSDKRARAPKRTKKLGPNDWLVDILVPKSLRPQRGAEPLTQLRMIKYQRRGFRPVYLLTTLIDPALYSREEITALYHVRWEAELGFREIKTSLFGNGSEGRKVHFRCKRPGRVLAEAYGALIAYNSIRLLMEEAANPERKVEPRFLSFMGCLDEIRAHLGSAGHVSQGKLPSHRERLIMRLCACRLPKRRERRYPRVVKAARSPYTSSGASRKAA